MCLCTLKEDKVAKVAISLYSATTTVHASITGAHTPTRVCKECTLYISAFHPVMHTYVSVLEDVFCGIVDGVPLPAGLDAITSSDCKVLR